MQDSLPSYSSVTSLGDANYPVLNCVKKRSSAATVHAQVQDVAGIHGMGFDPYLVQRALGMHDHNEERAIDALVNGLVADDRKQGAQGQQQHQHHNQQTTIHSMGFDPHLVARALQQFRGDEQQAVDALLSGRVSQADAPAPRHNPQPVDDAPSQDPQLAEARRHLLGLSACDLRMQIYIMMPAAARKAGWDTQRIQAALDLPSLGFSEGSPGERGVRLFDAIADGRLSIQQLQQAENAALEALAAAM